ncbi:MAG: aspartyl protease family protein [Acidobacteriota bacterium]|nr:aspartyl protease family protein [Acidobacteriota bacterium]
MEMTRCSRVSRTALVAAVLCVSAPQAQQHRMSMPDATIVTVTAENGVPEIPFELVNNHLILPISVNGSKPLRVVLDTGMPAPGLALFDGPKVESLSLDIDPAMQVPIRGAGGEGAHRMAKIAMRESLALDGLRIEQIQIILMPPHIGFGGYHDGIIGYSLLGRFVVELDYDRQVVRLHDPESYELSEDAEDAEDAGDAHVVPLTLRNRLPYITVGVTPYGGSPLNAEVVVDLGASHAISLNTDESDEIAVPDESLTTTLGRGLSGVVEGEVGRIAVLRLGGASLHDVVTSFPVSAHQNPREVDSLAGNLGSDVLRRFHIIFDYKGGRMILRPNESFRDRFRFDRSGLRLLPGADLEVERVIPGSPAEEAGVRVNDVVTHVNGESVSGGDYGEIVKALKGDGQIRLSLRRGEATLEKTLTLRRLI